MKTALDPRHLKRRILVEDLFKNDFHPQPTNQEAEDIIKNLKIIDSTIEKIAPEFPIDKINKIDLAILRLGIYEISIKKDIPGKVAVDEAVELAKEYGGESSPMFVNGALGKLLKK